MLCQFRKLSANFSCYRDHISFSLFNIKSIFSNFKFLYLFLSILLINDVNKMILIICWDVWVLLPTNSMFRPIQCWEIGKAVFKYIHSVSYKRFFRCKNCFLLLAYTTTSICTCITSYRFGRPTTDGNHLYETRVP